MSFLGLKRRKYALKCLLILALNYLNSPHKYQLRFQGVSGSIK